MTPREWTFCAHPSFRVLVLRLPDERGLEDHRSCSVSPWSLAQNAICFQRPFDQFLWGRDPFYCCPRSHSGTNKRLINKSGFSQLEMRVWREEKPSPLACTRAALQEGGLTKRSVLMAGVPRAGAAWWVLGVLSSRVPLGELSSRVPLGALSFRVPLGALSFRVPLGALSFQVPLGALSFWVPLEALSSRVPLGALSSRVPLGVLSSRVPLGALSFRVPLGALSSRVPLGALSSRVPLGALSFWVPLEALSSRVPLGALSSRVPLGALSSRVPLGVPSSWVPRLVVAERSLLGINPLMVAPLRLLHPNLITSRSPHLHIPSHQRLRLQHMNFEGTQPCRQQPGALLSTWCPLRV